MKLFGEWLRSPNLNLVYIEVCYSKGSVMAKVKFENITFSYGSNTILKDLSLEIEDGQIMGIVGPSGSGKTTLMRCLCGFIKPE